MSGNLDAGAAVARGDCLGGWKAATQSPLNEVVEAGNSFLSFKPGDHLRKLVLTIGCSICVFRKVDMEMLGMFCVIIVSRSKEPYRRGVVKEGVELQEVEVIPDAEFDKDSFARMEGIEGSSHFGNCVVGVRGKLCEIEEVQNSPHSVE